MVWLRKAGNDVSKKVRIALLKGVTARSRAQELELTENLAQVIFSVFDKCFSKFRLFTFLAGTFTTLGTKMQPEEKQILFNHLQTSQTVFNTEKDCCF